MSELWPYGQSEGYGACGAEVPPAGGFLLQRCKRTQKIAGGVAAYENTSAVPRVFPCPPPDPLLRGTHDWLNGSCGRR